MAKAALLFVGTADGLVTFSDPGASGRWLRVGHELTGSLISAVWPLFDEPQIILAGGPSGLWRSDNGGASWAEITPLAVVAFAGERATPRTIALATTNGAWQHSNDGGVSWKADASDLPVLAVPSRQELLLGGQSPVLLAVRDNRIERSNDNGASWEPTTSDTPLVGDITVIGAARYHIDTAFAGTSCGQLAASNDRGRTWQVIKHDLPAVQAVIATRLA